MLRAAGFDDVSVVLKPESAEYIKDWLPGSGAEQYVVSANVTARKPKPAAVAAAVSKAAPPPANKPVGC